MSRTPDLSAVAWRKSSYSAGGDANCVEIGHGIPTVVPVRDSKDPHGPALLFSPAAWTAFVTAVKEGDGTHLLPDRQGPSST
jgi:hypothetical protein